MGRKNRDNGLVCEDNNSHHHNNNTNCHHQDNKPFNNNHLQDNHHKHNNKNHDRINITHFLLLLFVSRFLRNFDCFPFLFSATPRPNWTGLDAGLGPTDIPTIVRP